MNYSDLEALVFGNHGTIFGGYVRDTIAGVEPSDMDVLMSRANRERFIAELINTGKPVTFVSHGNKDRYYYRFAFSRIKVDFEGMAFDLVVGDNWGKGLDFDVNGLKLTQRGNGLSCCAGLNIGEVLRNISRKQARRMKGCSEERLERMVAKGWRIL